MVTNEGIIRVFGATVLNPIAALGGALFVQPNTTMVAPFLPRIAQEGLIVVFVLLLFTGMVSWCNKTASRMALNNYFSSKSVKQESDLGLVLITGGAGGIGGELAQVLLARGLDVVVVDVLPLQFTGRTHHRPKALPTAANDEQHHAVADCHTTDATSQISKPSRRSSTRSTQTLASRASCLPMQAL